MSVLTSGNSIGGKCPSCAYSISIKNTKFGLPKRTYVWAGNDDDNNGEPDWCFAYGEEEWVSGEAFEGIKLLARGDLLAEPQILPEGRINCTTGAEI